MILFFKSKTMVVFFRTSIRMKVNRKNHFFTHQIKDLIFTCIERGINPILTHEVSYNPEINQNTATFYNMYEKIPSLGMYLDLSNLRKQSNN